MARRLSVRYGTVHHAIFKADVHTPPRREGRPHQISQALKRVAIRAITAGRADTVVDVQRLLAAGHSIDVASQTVRNMLKDSGLRAAPKVEKPLLTKRHYRLHL